MTASTAQDLREGLAQQALVLELVEGYIAALETNDTARREADAQRYEAKGDTSMAEIVRKPRLSWSVDTGRKYLKVVMTYTTGSGGSVHAFVDKTTGEVFKPEGWAKPAKGVRFNLLDPASREALYAQAEFSGGYLYR